MDMFELGKSDDLHELEQGLLDMEEALSQLQLAYGLTLLRIEEDGVWRQSGANNLRAYQIEHLEQLGIPKSTLSTRRLIARGYMDTKDVLGNVPLQGRLSKLIDLPRAIKIKGKEDALKHFKGDDWRAWKKYIRACSKTELKKAPR